MTKTRVLGVAVTLFIALASTATRAAPVPIQQPVPAPAQATHLPVRLAPLPPQMPIEIALVQRAQHQSGLDTLLAALTDPRSTQYHHFLTPAEFDARFGPSPMSEAQLAAVLRAAGLLVERPPESTSLLLARGTAASVEQLFGVQLDWYRTADGEQYYAPRAAPHIPAALSGLISGVLGLDSRRIPVTRPLLASRAGQGPAEGGLEPADLARVYDVGPLQAQGLTGVGQTIALAEIDSFRMSDITSYDHAFGITAPPVGVVTVGNGPSGKSPEATLDIEVLQAIAPRTHILAYEGGQELSQLAQTFGRMVADHRAQIISISLGACEAQTTGAEGRSFVNSLDNFFKQANAEGVSVLVASGDSGAYGCQDNTLSVDLPASSPYVTAVGGTTLFLASNGGYAREAGWEGPLEGAGSGGGLSRFYARPAWQNGPGVANSASDGMRQVPDVAADADPLTGYLIYFSGWQIVGGTSAAAPLWAGLIALADQSATNSGRPPLGFLNPALYALGSRSASPQAFRDVTIGGNLYYEAGPGWDYATGWGTPDAAVLIPALLSR